jgi:hypothetical protein
MRVQQIRNMGMIDENEPVSKNEWETVKQKGSAAIETWINDNMKYKRCVVVLIGKDTHERPWVLHEIKKAWNDGRGVFGIHIHNLNCPNGGVCAKGVNPFDQFTFTEKDGTVVIPPVYNPPANDTYNYIKNNLAAWVEGAIGLRK